MDALLSSPFQDSYLFPVICSFFVIPLFLSYTISSLSASPFWSNFIICVEFHCIPLPSLLTNWLQPLLYRISPRVLPLFCFHSYPSKIYSQQSFSTFFIGYQVFPNYGIIPCESDPTEQLYICMYWSPVSISNPGLFLCQVLSL